MPAPRGSGPGGVPAPGGCLVRGVCLLPGGCLVETVPTPGMATAAGSTHPTGMHSCYIKANSWFL